MMKKEGTWFPVLLCPAVTVKGIPSMKHSRTSRRLFKSVPNHLPLTVPAHKTIKPGLLRKILRDADLTIDEFVALLK